MTAIGILGEDKTDCDTVAILVRRILATLQVSHVGLPLHMIGRGLAKPSTSPHAIRQPKEALQRLSRRAHNKCVYSTNDNTLLAEKLDLDLCAQRCPALGDLRGFVQQVLA